MLCHQPGTPAQQTLIVPPEAVEGHLRHGDYLGECRPLAVNEKKPEEIKKPGTIKKEKPSIVTNPK